MALSLHPQSNMATVNVGTVEVYLVSHQLGEWNVLVLQRAMDTRCPGGWETVHGTIESGEEPEHAALREVGEETGLAVQRLYTLSVSPFYLHRTHTVELSVGFVAFVDQAAPVTLGREHTHYEWLSAHSALERFMWPRERTALREILQLFATGSAGPAEDVLRVV
ncbi:MAG: NUDIX domain-containing protein [bacterium]